MVPFTAGINFGLDVNTDIEIRDQLSPDLHTDHFDEAFDLSHTIQLVSTQVTDDAGNPVDATIQAASGFDYANPLTTPPPGGPGPGSIPEPPSVLLVAPGLILGYLTDRWRRSRGGRSERLGHGVTARWHSAEEEARTQDSATR